MLHHCLEHPSLNVAEALEADSEAYTDESEWCWQVVMGCCLMSYVVAARFLFGQSDSLPAVQRSAWPTPFP